MPKQKNTPAPTDTSPAEGREPLHGSGSDDLASRPTERAASEAAAAADAAVAPTTPPLAPQPTDSPPDDSTAVEPSTSEPPTATAAPVPFPLPRILLDGAVRKNPLLVAGLGLAPALLLSDAAAALTVGICTTLALLVTSLLASLCGRYLSEKFRPALFTLVAAGLTVALEFGTGALLPDLLPRTGICIALIAVGGLTLSRAEYSTARPPLAALVDALANGVGYTLALTLVGILREALGAGSVFGFDVTFGVLPPMTALTTASGGFILVGLLAAAVQGLRLARARRRAAAAKSKDKEVSA